MEFQSIIERLQGFVKWFRGAQIVVAVVEAILVILIGILSNKLQSEWDIYTFFLLFCALLYLAIIALRTTFNYSFAGSIINELKSERELSRLTRDAARQDTINEFFVQTMQRLNGQTCALTANDEVDLNLCDKDIQDGIADLIEPIISNVYFLLDTLNTHFTIGVYLDGYESLTVAGWDKGVLTIDDKLKKSHTLTKELFEKTDASGEQLSIQEALRNSFNNREFVRRDYETPDGQFSIVCSPMPLACNEEELLGVFFIISKKINITPADLPTKLTIFNRVIANWVYRYDECLRKQKQNKPLDPKLKAQ